MTGVAGQTRRAMSVGAADDHRPMWRHAIGLGRAIVRGMTIETARMLQHLAGLAEQPDRPCGPLRLARLTEGARRFHHPGRKPEKHHQALWGRRHPSSLTQFHTAIT